jgi:hypothetical protein
MDIHQAKMFCRKNGAAIAKAANDGDLAALAIFNNLSGEAALIKAIEAYVYAIDPLSTCPRCGGESLSKSTHPLGAYLHGQFANMTVYENATCADCGTSWIEKKRVE